MGLPAGGWSGTQGTVAFWEDESLERWEEQSFRLILVLFMQLWSWLASGLSLMSILEREELVRLQSRNLPLWARPLYDSFFARVTSTFVNVLFLFIAFHLLLIFTNPNNLRKVGMFPYLGVALNLIAFGFVMREVFRPGPRPCPDEFSSFSFLSYTIRRKLSHRIFAASMAFLMTFVTWLFPWCCVA